MDEEQKIMWTIGIICAGDKEIAPFLLRIEKLRQVKKAMLTFYEGEYENVRIVMLYSGVCKVNAAIAAQILIDSFHTDAIINAGTAGGMDKSVQLFDTVVSEQTAYHDVKETILTEFHPWMETVWFQSDQVLLKKMKEYSRSARYPILFGKTVTGESFIEDGARENINQKFAPLSVDMETAAIAHVCHVNQLPFLAIRTVTDTAAHAGTENFEKNCEKASRISCEITLDFIRTLFGNGKNEEG